MSRIGNLLDNREAEYFFYNIKSEFLNFYEIEKLNFTELENIISDYIYWYNNDRFWSIINWKTPQEAWGAIKH